MRWLDHLDSKRPIVWARAPGRLDLMGGIADYSGSLVLQLPLDHATRVAAQIHDESTIVATSTLATESTVCVALRELVPAKGPLDYSRAHELLTQSEPQSWAAYVAGALVVLHH